MHLSEPTSHTFTASSEAAEASRFPSIEKLQWRTEPSCPHRVPRGTKLGTEGTHPPTALHTALTNASPGGRGPQFEGGVAGGGCEEVACRAERTRIDVVAVRRERGGRYGPSIWQGPQPQTLVSTAGAEGLVQWRPAAAVDVPRVTLQFTQQSRVTPSHASAKVYGIT